MTDRPSAMPLFDNVIESLTKNFTGREWLSEEIDGWLNKRDEQFFILTGEPGIGKSAFVAYLVQQRRDIAAYHFCYDVLPSTIDPVQLSQALASQFDQFFPHWYETFLNQTGLKLEINVEFKLNIESTTNSSIQGVVTDNLHFDDALKGWNVILKTLSDLPVMPEHPIIILIDALDGAMTFDTADNIITLLSKIKNLPNWVRLILTTRFDLRVLDALEFLEPYTYYLAADSHPNLEDLYSYIQWRLSRDGSLDQLQRYQTYPKEFAEQLIKSSGGNFLFAKLILDEIESGTRPLSEITAFPQNLHEVYYTFLKRLTKEEWINLYRPIMQILTVTQEPVSFDQLVNFTNINQNELQQGWGKICQFLNALGDRKGEETYVIFNKSFQFFLLREDSSREFWCKAEDGHNRVVNYYLSQIF